jgi:hypothetical protein
MIFSTLELFLTRARLRHERDRRQLREDISSGDQVNRIAALALKHGKSVDFTGYWQRHVADA